MSVRIDSNRWSETDCTGSELTEKEPLKKDDPPSLATEKIVSTTAKPAKDDLHTARVKRAVDTKTDKIRRQSSTAKWGAVSRKKPSRPKPAPKPEPKPVPESPLSTERLRAMDAAFTESQQ